MATDEGVAHAEASPTPWKRRFFTLWGGQVFSLIGSALVQWALMFYLAVTTGSPIVLAIAGIMGLLPQVLLAPIAGAYIDRIDRKRVIIFADLLTALSTFLLVLLFLLGAADLLPIFLVMFFRSCMQAFHWPAMQAATSMMVPPEHLARVGGMNQALMGLSTILGPALGAALYVVLPMAGVLLIDIATAALAIAAVLAIDIPEIERVPAGRFSIRGDIVESFAFLRSWKGATLLIVIFSLINLLITPAVTLFSLLTLNHFGQGVFEVALIDIVAGAGLIAGGLVLGIWGGGERKMIAAMAATVLAGAGILTIGLLPSNGFYLAVVATLVAGAALAIVNGNVIAILQKGVPAALQGRVFALIGSIASGMAPLGLALSGPVSERFGLQSWFVAGGVFMVIAASVAFCSPMLMHMEDDNEGHAEADSA